MKNKILDCTLRDGGYLNGKVGTQSDSTLFETLQ
jgi:hypothetical protein